MLRKSVRRGNAVVKLKSLWWLVIAGSVWLPLAACQQAPPSPATPEAAVKFGRDLYQRLACAGCHALQGRGGEVGPPLDRAGTQLSPEELKTQIVTPRQRQANSRMPSFAFVRPVELQALLDYLKTLN